MAWPTAVLSDGKTYEVRHTIDAGFKARREGTVLWTDGSETLVGALRDAFEGTIDDEAQRAIQDAAARIMEQAFSNIPDRHRGQ
jgi:carbon monoxide dehydrogenase subunit G